MNEVYQQPEDKLEGIVKPMIYSRRAIWGFSVLFSTLFGGILLMQNLKDIGKRKEANLVLILSILITILTIVIVTAMGSGNRSVSIIFNIAGAAILTEYFYRKYFPDEADYEKKKIWKPLIIGIVICAILVAVVVMGNNQAAQ